MLMLRAERVRPGYSLIELVVVLTILASLAGLTVSIVGWLRQSADKSTAAHVMGSLLNNIELYHVSTGTYPNQFDSLLDGANLYAGNGTTDTGLHDELRTGSGAKLTTLALDANMLKSLNQAGITAVMDHQPLPAGESIPGNTGTNFRALASGGQVAGINTTSSNPEALGIIDSIYPPLNGGASGTGLPANVQLIAFGFGPRCTSVGKTVAAPPSYSGVGDVTLIYNRFVCVFAVFADGSPAQLKTVLDAKGDYLNQELAEFYRSKPQ